MKIYFELQTPYGSSEYVTDCHPDFKNIFPQNIMWDWKFIRSYIFNRNVTIEGKKKKYNEDGELIDTERWPIYNWPARRMFEHAKKVR